MKTEVPETIRPVWRWLAAGAVLGALWFGGASPVAAQGRARGRRQSRGVGGMRRPPAPRMDKHRHQPGFFKRLRDLPPEEQERVMANDARFQRLPPERQQQIRENLRRWNALSPEEKQRLRERQEIFESLSPQQREQARAIFQQWRQLSPGRRQELMQAFRQMRDLPPKQRKRFLTSPETEARFSPEERNMLEGLGKLLPKSRREAAGDADE